MTLFWHPTGPLVVYTKNVLNIHDLNPERHTRWYVTRWDMFRIGLRCMWAAIVENKEQSDEL